MNGFTTLRDLETEGAMYADVDVKTAINRGFIPGPRLFVATRAFASTGAYPLLGYSWELRMPEGVQIVDGADNIRRAVREQVNSAPIGSNTIPTAGISCATAPCTRW